MLITILPAYIINLILFYVFNLVAYICKPLIIWSEFGIIVNANRKSFWVRSSGNPTIEDGYENYVYEQV